MPILLFAILLQTATPSFRTVEKGAQSLVDSARQVTARTDAEWQAIWRQHSPARALPAVDFAREMVVGIFLGSRPTAGYGADVAAVRDEQGVLIVQYRETQPGPERITAQVLTSPYHLIAVPKHDGAVRFEKIN